jgi:ABC-type multidrug transport system fused ATPase/permease subunit
MKDFFRSLGYLRPYRLRLGAGVLCAVLIAVLWGGGLAMLLPGAKVLISPEGLHGWAWNSLITEKLGASVVQRVVPPNTLVAGEPVTLVLDVVEPIAGGPADRAGIAKGDWIVSLRAPGEPTASPDGNAPSVDDGDTRAPREILRGDVLARRLANVPPGGEIVVGLYSPLREDEALRTARVTLQSPGFQARALGAVARAIPEPETYYQRFDLLLWLLGVALVLTVVRNALRFLQEYLVQTAVLRSVIDLREENYAVVLRLPVTFFSEKGTSDTMSRFVQDTAELARGQMTLFGKTLVEPCKAVASIVVALLFSWRLTLLAMVAGPPVLWIIRRFGKRMKKASRRALESWSSMLGILEETLTGIRVVKAYTMEATERRRFHHANRRLMKQQRRMARIDAATAPIVEALGVGAALAAAALAGYWVFTHRMEPADFLALMACLAAMFDPLRKLAKVATRFQRADAAAARIFELHDQPPQHRRARAPSLPEHAESLSFREVSYRYPSATRNALDGVDLTVQAGQTVAIVGPNGCGKTTLVSLVPRLLDPTGGAVLLDGLDVREHSLRSLRRQIALVTQETVIFHATVRENVSYGLRRCSDDRVLDAARRAFVDEFVSDLPEGYETMVGEHGSTLSGGQRQRIAIARAILRDPRILIFDEATSQIDADSERRIHQAMAEFIRGRTALIIAHRFQSIMSADRVVVLDDGRLIATGTHRELLATCELYRHLYKTQFISDDEEPG